MQEAEEKIIPLNKEKLALMAFLCCIFMGIGAWLVFRDSTAIQLLGLALILICGLSAGYYIKKSFDKRPALIFNSAGIIDNRPD